MSTLREGCDGFEAHIILHGCSSYFASGDGGDTGSWEYGDPNYAMRFVCRSPLDRSTLSLSIIPSRCLFQVVLQPTRGSVTRMVPIGEEDHYSLEMGETLRESSWCFLFRLSFLPFSDHPRVYLLTLK